MRILQTLKRLGPEYRYTGLVVLILLVVFLIVAKAPICPNQYETWRTCFLGYASLSAVVAAVILFALKNAITSTDDYRKQGVVFADSFNVLYLFLVTIGVFGVILVLLTIDACTNLPMWAILISTSLALAVLVPLTTLIIGFWNATKNPELLTSYAKKRLLRIAKLEATESDTPLDNSNGFDGYRGEIKYVLDIVRDDITNGRTEHAKEALEWFRENLIGLVAEELTPAEIQRIGFIRYCRNELAKLSIDASRSRNRGLYNSILIETELTAQQFVRPGMEGHFHAILDSFQLAFGRQPDCMLLEEFVRYYSPFGNLRAAIRALEGDGKLPFKQATLSTTLVLICYSFKNPDCIASCARLIKMLLDLDTAFLEDGEVTEDYTGLGCWLLMFRLMKRISGSNPCEEIRTSAQLQYDAMLAKTNAPGFPWDHFDEGRECVQTHEEKVMESSTGSSFNFCITDSLPGYHGQLKIYVSTAITKLQEIRRTRQE